MRPHGKHFVLDPQYPLHSALCQRCGDLYRRCDLIAQRQWAGRQLIDTGFRVCPRCLDVPNAQDMTLILPPDPPPIFDALPIAFPLEEDDYMVDENQITEILDENETTQIVPEGDGGDPL
jgi:hypothetical protein